MNVYENVIILNAALPDEEIGNSVQKVREIITATGGEFLKADLWGRRKLAYEINKQTRGFYVLVLIKAAAATVKKLEEHFKVTDTVIKYMFIKLEKKQKEAALKAVPVEPQSV